MVITGDMDEIHEEFLSVIKFAILLDVHPNTIRRLIKNGRISAIRLCVGKRTTYRIAKSEINRLAVVDLEEIIEKIIEKRKCQNPSPPNS